MQLGGVHCITLRLWAVSTTVQVWDLWLEPHRYWQRPETKLGVMFWWGFSYKSIAPRSLGLVVLLISGLLVCVLLLLLCLECLIFVLTFGFLYYFWSLQLCDLNVKSFADSISQFIQWWLSVCSRGSSLGFYYWFPCRLLSLLVPRSFFVSNLWCTKCFPIQIHVWIRFV